MSRQGWLVEAIVVRRHGTIEIMSVYPTAAQYLTNVETVYVARKYCGEAWNPLR
jgi:hypothetical protein